MFKIILKTSGDEFWDRIAGILGGETGEVTGSPYTDGKQFYNAVFPNYGEVTWIPDTACTVIEVPDPTV
ncbi:MAG: hypothetical protein EBR40_11025 [Proteobacteria bacterium]|nr:hypothetical protein [Pseudomonadota bacterium]